VFLFLENNCGRFIVRTKLVTRPKTIGAVLEKMYDQAPDLFMGNYPYISRWLPDGT
jgi:hypothetical protein